MFLLGDNIIVLVCVVYIDMISLRFVFYILVCIFVLVSFVGKL